MNAYICTTVYRDATLSVAYELGICFNNPATGHESKVLCGEGGLMPHRT